MTPIARDELIILRHAQADHGGRLCGRTDVSACLPQVQTIQFLRHLLSGSSVVASPARRCRETATAIFKDIEIRQDERLWEQDFGVDEGKRFEDLPDLGPLPLNALARHAAQDGESFLDMVERVKPALLEYADRARKAGPIILVAHAGTARAALGLALDQPESGLKFEINPLSITRLRCLDNAFSIIATNEQVVS